MMKTFRIPAFLTLALLIILASCEDVIILDLKNSEHRLVIDAALNATRGECVVQVTQSLDFYQADTFSRIGGALVELVNGSGVARSLAEVRPGVYSAGNLKIIAGEDLLLNVTLSPDEKYSARTQAPEPVTLDSLKVVRGFGDPRPTSPPVYLINPKWKDPAGTANYYRFKVTRNGKARRGSFHITNDDQFDGTEVDMPLYWYDFELGDTVRLEFQSIDSTSYAYFNQINDMARPSFVSATPYNPIGNFNNGALGYFGIYWSEMRNLIITSGK